MYKDTILYYKVLYSSMGKTYVLGVIVIILILASTSVLAKICYQDGVKVDCPEEEQQKEEPKDQSTLRSRAIQTSQEKGSKGSLS